MANNVGVWPFTISSPATALQQYRILTNDDNPTQIDATTGTYKFLSDASAQALIDLYNGEPRLAAARELESIAVSEALLRSWSSDDLSVNGDKVAEALRKLAAQLRAEVVDGVALEDDFEIVSTGTDEYDYQAELVTNPYGYRFNHFPLIGFPELDGDW